MPNEIAATLTPDTLLTDPQTGRQVPLKNLSTRALDRALDELEGKPPHEDPKPPLPSDRASMARKGRRRKAAVATQPIPVISDAMGAGGRWAVVVTDTDLPPSVVDG